MPITTFDPRRDDLTKQVRGLLAAIRIDLGIAQRMLKTSGYSALETRLTMVTHQCSDALAICADQSYGPHYWEPALHKLFACLAEVGTLGGEMERIRRNSVNYGCGYAVVNLEQA